MYDLIIAGAGPAGMLAALSASQEGKKVLILEKMSAPGLKLRATGGGRCNLTNTLPTAEYMERFGRNGRFMQPALELMDADVLRQFMQSIGVETHAPDGFRVFPVTHSSSTVCQGLLDAVNNVGIVLKTREEITSILHENRAVKGVVTEQGSYTAPNVLLSTGGCSYPSLGADGAAFRMVEQIGHKVTSLYPGMVPLNTLEKWPSKLTAHTVPKVEVQVNLKKFKKLKGTGDLIFTTNGLTGPVIQDLSREITPLLEKYPEVPLIMNLTRGVKFSEWLEYLLDFQVKNPSEPLSNCLGKRLATPIARVLATLAGLDAEIVAHKMGQISRKKLLKLSEIFGQTPLTITSSAGFPKAMITRGGVSLKQVNPHTLESKLISGLYFAGEMLDLDGPCGGYNLQWAFSSGFLAGKLF